MDRSPSYSADGIDFDAISLPPPPPAADPPEEEEHYVYDDYESLEEFRDRLIANPQRFAYIDEPDQDEDYLLDDYLAERERIEFGYVDEDEDEDEEEDEDEQDTANTTNGTDEANETDETDETDYGLDDDEFAALVEAWPDGGDNGLAVGDGHGRDRHGHGAGLNDDRTSDVYSSPSPGLDAALRQLADEASQSPPPPPPRAMDHHNAPTVIDLTEEPDSPVLQYRPIRPPRHERPRRGAGDAPTVIDLTDLNDESPDGPRRRPRQSHDDDGGHSPDPPSPGYIEVRSARVRHGPPGDLLSRQQLNQFNFGFGQLAAGVHPLSNIFPYHRHHLPHPPADAAPANVPANAPANASGNVPAANALPNPSLNPSQLRRRQQGLERDLEQNLQNLQNLHRNMQNFRQLHQRRRARAGPDDDIVIRGPDFEIIGQRYVPVNPLHGNQPELNYQMNGLLQMPGAMGGLGGGGGGDLGMVMGMGMGLDLDMGRPPHVPPPPAREGFTRDTGEDVMAVCASCDEELVYDPDGDGDGDARTKRARSRKDREEHHFWAVTACGHVYCKRCFENRRNKDPTLGFSSNGKATLCAVEGCESDVTLKRAWVGLFL